jgi:endoglucanase
MKNYIRIKDRTLVCDGQEMRFRGVNFGSWLNIEGFMIGLPYVEHKMRECFADVLGERLRDAFFDGFVDTCITEGDFKLLHEIGFNLVRVPFNYRHFESDLEPYRYNEKPFGVFDSIIRWAKKYGVYILFDFHAVPGSQSEDWHSDNASIDEKFFDVKDYQDRAVALWKEIARRYRDEEIVFGYDLINEPNTRYPERLNAYYHQAIKAIRGVDKNHIIVVEGNRWSDEIESLDTSLFRDTQVMATFHHYPFMGLKKYPCVRKGKRYDRKALVATMKNKFAFYRKINRPLLLGECGFSSWRKSDGSYQVLTDLLTVMEEHKIHWTLWSYKDVGAMGFVVPRKNTPWKQFIHRKDNQKAHQTRHRIWRKMHSAFHKNYSDVPEIIRRKSAKLMARGVEQMELYQTVLRLKKLGAKKIAAMPRSFHISNCEVNPKALRMVRAFL